MLAPFANATEKAKVYKRLLVAIDGSDVAESILTYALGISRATGSQLALVRIVDDEAHRAQASSYLDALAARLQVEAHCVSAGGDVASALLEEAARVPDTLIAMTTHGRSGELGAVRGSVAMNVLLGGHARCCFIGPTRVSAVTSGRQDHPGRRADGFTSAESIGAGGRACTLARRPLGRDLGAQHARKPCRHRRRLSECLLRRPVELGSTGSTTAGECCMAMNPIRQLPILSTTSAAPCWRGHARQHGASGGSSFRDRLPAQGRRTDPHPTAVARCCGRQRFGAGRADAFIYSQALAV
jgi:nucleotide-binding universal stress UspA family protein